MARLTRKFLKALGVEDESKMDEIIEAHRETVDALTAERDQYKADVEKYKPDAEKLPAIQKQLDEMKNNGDPYEDKYNQLKQEYDNYKTGIENEKVMAKKTAAYKKLLKEAGVSEKRIDAVLKVSNDIINGIEFDDKDEVKNSKDITTKVKDEWADFIEISGTRGADVSTPPSGNGTGGTGGGAGLSRAAQIAMKHNQSIWGVAPSKEEN